MIFFIIKSFSSSNKDQVKVEKKNDQKRDAAENEINRENIEKGEQKSSQAKADAKCRPIGLGNENSQKNLLIKRLWQPRNVSQQQLSRVGGQVLFLSFRRDDSSLLWE